jgi:Rad3-related DNA helicase
MAHKLFRPTLIVDEAHGLIPTIQDLEAKKLWQHDWRFPNSLRNYADLAWWLESLEDYQKTDLLLELEEELHSTRPKYIVERTKDWWRRTTPPEQRSLLKLLPIDIRDAMPHFWPAKTKKIVLMSATISRKDIEALGLDRRRVLYLEATSPIPISNRPIIPINVVGVNAGNLKPATKKIADYIKQVLLPKHEHEKGVIHATYQQARLLREYLGDLDGRIIYHDKTNTQTQFDKFTNAPPESGAVFVASGLYEGIDLAYDLGRWQCIAKIPWLSLVDPAVKYKSQQDEEWYIWETAKKTIQACGRISRTPTDYGVTYVLDSTFERMRSKLVDYGLAPQWWLEAITGPASLDKPK